MADPDESTALAATWDDVLRPGESEGSPGIDLFAGLSLPAPSDGRFSLADACFLAAQSLLIYRGYADGAGQDSTAELVMGRRTVLGRIGLEETYCGEIAGTACSIFEPSDRDDDAGAATVVFRGTTHLKNWLTNLQSVPGSWPGGGHVHGGFASAHREIWGHIAPRLEAFAKAGRPLLITGHSLGGALATLTLAEFLKGNPGSVAAAYTFGSPRVGNAEFAAMLEGAPLYRMVNGEDLVTRLPLAFALSRRLSFLHAGCGFYMGKSDEVDRRGVGDLAEEAAGLTQVRNLLGGVTEAFRRSRPPGFLADHAPVKYLEKLRRACGKP